MRSDWMKRAVWTALLLTCCIGPNLADGRQDLILSANLDGTSVQTTLELLGFCGGIALDPDAGKIYFTDLGPNLSDPAGGVWRANLDGSNAETLIAGPYHKRPSAIALDVAGDKVYWTDKWPHVVRRANLDGTSIETLIAYTDLWQSLALDLQNGKMYLGTSSDIFRADLDGNNFERVVYSYDSWHHGIAVDAANGKMYWTEMRPGTVKRANLDGTARETLVSDAQMSPRGIALDLTQGRMYWANWSSYDVRRANLDGSDVEILFAIRSPMHAIAVDPGGDKLYASTFIIEDVVVPATSAAGAMIMASLIVLCATALLVTRKRTA